MHLYRDDQEGGADLSPSLVNRRVMPEWIRRSPDTTIPPRVQLRMIERAGDCYKDCGRAFSATQRPEIDHTIALINGSESCEREVSRVSALT